ncbi:MAG: hypothetical protein IM486_05090 [Microcystis sp. M114S2]|jgi:hypothetical protein|uniref:hypothetical protein n=1 Tax=unclassified Microcystis TaxID=2643300 RepID=UPI00258A6695|nr:MULTISPECIES: hypothetical protein [unclassified Microcystis]MCA2803478.1 hypothetical protein [Microcystis sp. M114S2]MCA2848198.1 hypothetical protein [Microcystis sp. M074S1]
MSSADLRQYAPATERNRQPILVRSPLLSVGLRHETQHDQLLIYLVGVGLHFV